MAGSKPKYRHLSRNSSHRQALLRNLVTSLFEHEAISTTWAKAKEAQRLAEKLITLGKKNTNAARDRAQRVFYVGRFLSAAARRSPLAASVPLLTTDDGRLQTPHELMPKLFGPIRERYLDRPGGYTRVLRIEPLKNDQAPCAILELVDGPRDMRFAMTARAVARQRVLDEKREQEGGQARGLNEITLKNVKKVTRYRHEGDRALEKLVVRFEKMGVGNERAGVLR
ncbi:MAG: hypothetical protein M1826_001502 [Phylliscum demangeonii]|nr:MAG: hypothetical protein M1826_001502 [Phylliscum demangeonii]